MTTTINNEHKKLNVPNLRFPEFQGEWEKYELGDICDIITDFVAAGSFASLRENVKYYQENNYAQLIRTIDLKNNFTNSDFVYVDEVAYDFLWRVQLKEPNIVLPNIGANIGEKYYVKPQDLPKNKNVLGPNAILLRSKCNDTHFVYFRLSTSSYDNEMKKLVGASGQPKFNKTDLKKVSLFMPSLIEQKRIAYFLALLEERIATQNKIIEDLKKLKSAISKQVFAQKPSGSNRLDSLFSKGKAGGTPTSTNKEYYNGEIPFLSINDITKQGKYVRYTENHLSQSGLENSSAWVVPKYSLIMSMYASVGLVTINEIPITTSQAMFAMQLKNKDLLDYLYYYLSYFKYRHIHKYLETGTQSNINADIVRGIMIPTYGHSRNMEISSTLQGIDVKIDNELSVLKLFNRQKNYLLSQMFI